jgi:hypothetical protein
VLGVGVTVVGLVGRSYVQNQLAREAIVGSADMTPAKIEPAIKQAGLEGVSALSCWVAGEKLDTGRKRSATPTTWESHAGDTAARPKRRCFGPPRPAGPRAGGEGP